MSGLLKMQKQIGTAAFQLSWGGGMGIVGPDKSEIIAHSNFMKGVGSDTDGSLL